jgi:hypothetical protein
MVMGNCSRNVIMGSIVAQNRVAIKCFSLKALLDERTFSAWRLDRIVRDFAAFSDLQMILAAMRLIQAKPQTHHADYWRWVLCKI